MSENIFQNDLLQRIEYLENELEQLKNNQTLLLQQNKNLKKTLNVSTEDMDSIFKNAYDMEVKFIYQQQYSRCENIEIHNIPESISQPNLEKYIIEVLASIKIKVVLYDISAVHHIGQKKGDKPRIVCST